MYTIKHAAALTGVPEATLRAWERRYAVVSPHRTAAGYRLYDEDQLDVLRTMQERTRPRVPVAGMPGVTVPVSMTIGADA